jgi:hypothetical protein
VDNRARKRKAVLEVSGTQKPAELGRRHREKVAQAPRTRSPGRRMSLSAARSLILDDHRSFAFSCRNQQAVRSQLVDIT